MNIRTAFLHAAYLPLRIAASTPVLFGAGTTMITWHETEWVGRSVNLASTAIVAGARAYQVLTNKSAAIPWAVRTGTHGVTIGSITAKSLLLYGLNWPGETFQKFGMMICLFAANATKWRMAHQGKETEKNPVFNPDTYNSIAIGAVAAGNNPLMMAPVVLALLRTVMPPLPENASVATIGDVMRKHITGTRLLGLTCLALAAQQAMKGDYQDAIGFGLWTAGFNVFEPVRNSRLWNDLKTTFAPKP